MTGVPGFSTPVLQTACELLSRLDAYDRKARPSGEALRLMVDTKQVIGDLSEEVKKYGYRARRLADELDREKQCGGCRCRRACCLCGS